MTKINQIQNAIRGLDGGTFQKLADSYLLKKGYPQVNPVGSVIGANKVKRGTPDTLIPLTNGKYVFAEYTTQQKDVASKFADDLVKCFDENKTGIAVEKIQEVVFCHTTDLLPAELDSLRVTCGSRHVNLSVFDIGAISNDLAQKFPGIAKEYLGIDIDSGQIVFPDEFVRLCGRGKLATRLDTAFRFRDSEIQMVGDAMERNDLIIIEGKAGVGKTRFALECCSRFADQHRSWRIKCIYNRGVDLFQDIRTEFSDSKEFLIVVDDANRISGFKYIIDLLQTQRNDQRIKVVATVRDYALRKVQETCHPYGDAFEICLDPLTDEQIRQLAKEEYGINNRHFLDRIADISRGNPRLAIMAAEIAKEKDTLDSIDDVSGLYDSYYSSIRNDLSSLQDKAVLKVAGIVAFLRVVDRSDKGLSSMVQDIFGVSEMDFWNAARDLHEMELLDMYENEVAKVSDQVLATYLLYMVFFKDDILDFGLVLDHRLFPSLRHRLIDAINPVLSAFDTQAVMRKMNPAVDKVWRELAEDDKGDDFQHLVEVFWFLKETDTLLYVRKLIEQMSVTEVNLQAIEFKGDSNARSPIPRMLRSFIYAKEANFKIALRLLFDYVNKCPTAVGEVLYCLTDDFGFGPNSYLVDFAIQRFVIDMAWEQSQHGKNIFFSKLFVALAGPYLRTHFSQLRSHGLRSVNITNFDLPNTPSLLTLRRQIWRHLFELYQISDLRESIVDLLREHIWSGIKPSVVEIIRNDATEVLFFLDDTLDPSDIRHCLVAEEYFRLLARLGIPFALQVKERFQSKTLILYKLLTSEQWDNQELNLGYKEFEEYKKQQVGEYTKGYSEKDYARLFKECAEMRNIVKGTHSPWKLSQGIVIVLGALAGRDQSLYVRVLSKYIREGNALGIGPYFPIKYLIASCGTTCAYEILTQEQYQAKGAWLFTYYQVLAPEEIQSYHVEQLLTLYRETSTADYINDLDFLLKYQRLDKDIIAKVVTTVLDKSKVDMTQASVLSLLFSPVADIGKDVIGAFKGNMALLVAAYFAVNGIESYMDHDGRAFSQILEIDPDFACKYIDHMFGKKEWLTRREDARDYSFLWKRPDYLHLMDVITQRVFDRERGAHFFCYLEAFFQMERQPQCDASVIARQDEFLKTTINRRHSDTKFMEFLFYVIANLPRSRRGTHIATFLKANKDFAAFKRLTLEPSMSSWSGSRVPTLQGEVDYYESLLPLCDSPELLEHKQYIEHNIRCLRKEIESEKRNDFAED